MKFKSCSAAALGLALGVALAPIATSRAYAAPAEGYQVRWPWDQPPPEFKEMERKGFHDGVQGATKDYDHHRFPNVENRSEYKHPHVDPSFREDYRRGFRRGYDDAMKHLMESQGEHR